MPDRSLFLNKTIGVRVTEADYARLQALADAEGKPVGEWCRDVLLDLAQNTGDKPKPIEQALLAEVIALRTIVANLTYAFTSDGKVTREHMLAVIDRADKTKLKRATDLFAQVSRNGDPKVESQDPEKGES
jgi:hypothetical protein